MCPPDRQRWRQGCGPCVLVRCQGLHACLVAAGSPQTLENGELRTEFEGWNKQGKEQKKELDL